MALICPAAATTGTASWSTCARPKAAEEADLFIQIKPRKDFEALWTLRALAKGVLLDPVLVEAETGVPLATFQALMDKMKKAKYGVILFGMGLTMNRGKHLNTYALLSLARDMNAHTRFVCKPDARPRQRHRCRQRGDLANGIPVRGEPGPRLSPV